MSLAAAPLWEQAHLRNATGETLRPGGFSLTDRACKAIGLAPGWRVLDVGCGLGATVGRLRSRYGARAWGVESSQVQLDRAGRPGLVRSLGDVLPFADGVFQAVFCECVLSLFDDSEKALREFARVLEPGGALVVSDLYSSRETPVDSGSCAGRAVTLATTEKAVVGAGFTVQAWEDHSPHLKELAIRLAWAGEERDSGCTCGHRLGYYLMIAIKNGA